MTHPPTPTITIRMGYSEDRAALARLAALDSAEEVPSRPLLLADVDGELRVALSLRDGAVIADPFFPTADLIELLRKRADTSRAVAMPRRGVRQFRLGVLHG